MMTLGYDGERASKFKAEQSKVEQEMLKLQDVSGTQNISTT
jgi:hypothetical protein